MASSGKFKAVAGTDGTDFAFRQTVDNAYQVVCFRSPRHCPGRAHAMIALRFHVSPSPPPQNAANAKKKLNTLSLYAFLLAAIIAGVGAARSTGSLPLLSYLGARVDDFPLADFICASVWISLALLGRAAVSGMNGNLLYVHGLLCRVGLAAVLVAVLRTHRWIGLLGSAHAEASDSVAVLLSTVLHIMSAFLLWTSSNAATIARGTFERSTRKK